MRVRDALTGLATRYASHTAVVVSHGGVLGSLAAQLIGTPPNDWSRYQIQNCSVTHLEITTDGSIFHRFNDCAHLNALDAAPVRGSSPSSVAARPVLIPAPAARGS